MSKRPTWNIHTHTHRCGHAYGTDEEYVQKAMEIGINYLGFSDHVFIPGRSDPRIRGDYSELEGYIASIRALEKKYEGRVTIKLGFEAEWMDEYADYYADLLHSKKIDYLILGQHCRIMYDRFFGYGYLPDVKDRLEFYCIDLLCGIQSGLFTYVCHPDLFTRFVGEWDEKCEEISHRICKEAAKYGLPLEFNFGNSRGAVKNFPGEPAHMTYPHPRFWEIAKQYDVPVVLGVDAHHPNHFRESDYDWAYRFIEALGLKLVDSWPLNSGL